MSEEKALTREFEKYFGILGKSLDEFERFQHADALEDKQEWLEVLNQPLPQVGFGTEKVVELIGSTLLPNGSPVPKPGFTSFITTGATTSSVIASSAAAVASPQRYLLTAFNYLEELSLDWLAEMLGVKEMKGVYSSGGSVANLVALGGARQYAYEKLGVDPAANGIDRPARIYASADCHHTIQRSAGVLGLGRRAVVPVPCDRSGKMEVSALNDLLNKDKDSNYCVVAIVANAGTTDCGAIDPLWEIGQLAKKREIWFHVDGAYGLPGILDERYASQYRGLELADSVIVDPHKWLGASVGIAATLVKNREFLFRAFTQEPADYLEGSSMEGNEESSNNSSMQSIEKFTTEAEHSLDNFGIPYFDYGVELSAPCRGVVVWAMLQEIGVEGIKQRVTRHNDMAFYVENFAKKHSNLEVVNEASLSICCFRYVDSAIKDLNEFNRKLHRQLVRENTNMPSTTKVDGKLAIRPCFVGARTEMQQAYDLMNDVVRIGDSLLTEEIENF